MTIDLSGVVLCLVNNIEFVESSKEHLLSACDGVANNLESIEGLCSELGLAWGGLSGYLSINEEGSAARGDKERSKCASRGRHLGLL